MPFDPMKLVRINFMVGVISSKATFSGKLCPYFGVFEVWILTYPLIMSSDDVYNFG